MSADINYPCNSTAQCAVAGTACQQHGLLKLCIPTDKTYCNDVDSLFVVPVRHVYTMFCRREDIAKVTPTDLTTTCETQETQHRGVCLLPECTTGQIAAGSLDCWVSELPTGAIAKPTDDKTNQVTRKYCTSSAECKGIIAGTSCVKHGATELCVPDDRSGCTAVDPLFTVPVKETYFMMCNQAYPLPASAYNQTCASYEGSHGGLCLLPGCTEAQLASGSKQCFLEALPGSQVVDLQAVSGGGNGGLPGGAIAGIIVGVIAVLGLVGAGFIWLRRRDRAAGTTMRLDGFDRKLRGENESTFNA